MGQVAKLYVLYNGSSAHRQASHFQRSMPNAAKKAVDTSLGIDVEQRFAQALEGKAVVDKQPKLEGRSMMMFLSPSPTK